MGCRKSRVYLGPPIVIAPPQCPPPCPPACPPPSLPQCPPSPCGLEGGFANGLSFGNLGIGGVGLGAAGFGGGFGGFGGNFGVGNRAVGCGKF
jgi:hypothetical protein